MEASVMTDFNNAFAIVVGEEGGYVDNPKDPGGETKFGISRRSYPDLDIKNLTLEDARQIYKRNYWDVCRCDELPYPVGLVVFDGAINMGNSKSVKLLQKAVKISMTDGVIGPRTLKAVHDLPADKVLVEYLVAQAFFKISLKTFSVFGLGWMRRLIRIAIHAARA
jgi:lysozyme family protein